MVEIGEGKGLPRATFNCNILYRNVGKERGCLEPPLLQKRWNKRSEGTALERPLLQHVGRNGEIKRGYLEPHVITIEWKKFGKRRDCLEPPFASSKWQKWGKERDCPESLFNYFKFLEMEKMKGLLWAALNNVIEVGERKGLPRIIFNYH